MLSHPRGPLTYTLGIGVGAALLVLTPRVGSLLVSLGSGLAAGGAVATVVCGLAWRGGVPNPLVRGGIAFNIADVAIGLGAAVLVGGALLQLWLRRDRLFDPI